MPSGLSPALIKVYFRNKLRLQACYALSSRAKRGIGTIVDFAPIPHPAIPDSE